jgi:uncharacterized membrane protein
MNLRLALYDLVAAHQLDSNAMQRLQLLAGLHAQPVRLRERLPGAIAVLAAALGGLGVIMWIAANWDSLGRIGQFALLQGLVLVACAGALWRPAARAPLGLLALLAIGGLFAYFGQTYQTGADPWQLFALWSLLALPLCLAVRSDVLWAPWALVTMTAISLWVHAHAGPGWFEQVGDLQVHLSGWGAAVVMILALRMAPRSFTGAGAWPVRVAITLAVVQISFTGMLGLIPSTPAPHYMLALLMLAAAAAAFAQREAFDVYALSAVALGVNSLLVGGLARLMLEGDGDLIGSLLLIGIAAACLLAASVSLILWLNRTRGLQGASA